MNTAVAIALRILSLVLPKSVKVKKGPKVDPVK